ncbi:deoxynucleoside monophosphate kinase [Vibrio phage Vp_R1]|uniref:Uncharacterized protein n=1 Tax=Vibrio phage Vp_R1 TaxID=2059867 RepID=A0A2H5BQ97_9CAUD|nr:deoxynucleoside monophosphate kinase [Vibrio phage Vp_R1]AUG88507.1 hypothetical protein VPR_143 [Vibrio phage Vp_R1]
MFKEELYRATAAHYELSLWEALPYFTERCLKDEKTILFEGLSPREALIHVSEDIIKPLHGKCYFGDRLSDKVQEYFGTGHDTVIVTDGGFKEEIVAVLDNLPSVKVKIVHLSRPDCSFEGDSRDYIEVSANNVSTYSLALEVDNIELGVTGLQKIISD